MLLQLAKNKTCTHTSFWAKQKWKSGEKETVERNIVGWHQGGGCQPIVGYSLLG